MMYEMRRKDRAIGDEEARAILDKGEYGILATVDGQGQPYTVPISYIFYNGKLYFHSALKGHKLDNLKDNPRVSFCVVGPTTERVFLGTDFSTNYESCVVFGTARMVTDEAESHNALYALTVKYFPDKGAEAEAAIQAKGRLTAVVAVDIAHMTGKSRR